MISFLGKAELAQMDEPNIELKCQSVRRYMMFLPSFSLQVGLRGFFDTTGGTAGRCCIWV